MVGADDAHLALMREEVMAAARALSAELGEPGSQSAAHERSHAVAG
jgi:hypothetical protein